MAPSRHFVAIEAKTFGRHLFFHRNLLERSGNDLLVRDIDHLRDAVRQVRINHPFTIRAWIVLPDHLHCVIDLPSGDTDFATRCRLIIVVFSKSIPKTDAFCSALATRRLRDLATSLLGAFDTRRTGFRCAHGLRAYQSTQAWFGQTRGGPAIFNVAPSGGFRCFPTDWASGVEDGTQYVE
ncbi:hypothetical protein ACFQAT_20705 [Undibacterium arcticum]|uniref:Transposase IS200-like domain-containing protein n=1 Tax=Undibacterium arcticum TaxID=1762892 RepID=A0ABV7EYT6_9BURK